MNIPASVYIHHLIWSGDIDLHHMTMRIRSTTLGYNDRKSFLITKVFVHNYYLSSPLILQLQMYNGLRREASRRCEVVPLDKMTAFSQTIFSDAFLWTKIFIFWLKISLKFIPQDPIDNNPPLVSIMTWRRIGAGGRWVKYVNRKWHDWLWSWHIIGVQITFIFYIDSNHHLTTIL